MKQRGVIVAGGLCIVLALMCLPAGVSRAGETVDAAWCEQHFIDGVRAYGQLDYRSAETMLETTAAACVDNPAIPPHTQAGILEQLGFTKVAVGSQREAEDAFTRLLMLMPDRRLDEQKVSPKIVGVFNRVRDRMRRSGMLQRMKRRQTVPEPAPKVSEPEPVAKTPAAPPAAVKPVVKKTPPVPPPPLPKYDLSLRLGAMLLFGKDMSAFGGGILMGLEADFRLKKGLYLGLGFSYGLHPTSSLQDEAKLHQMYGEVLVGYLFDLDPVRLKLAGKAGFGGYGLDDPADNAAFVAGVQTGLDVPLPHGVVLGLVAEYNQIVNMEGDSSSMAAIALRAGYQW